MSPPLLFSYCGFFWTSEPTLYTRYGVVAAFGRSQQRVSQFPGRLAINKKGIKQTQKLTDLEKLENKGIPQEEVNKVLTKFGEDLQDLLDLQVSTYNNNR